jgi:hypothetical protein
MVAFLGRGYTRPHVRERRVGRGPIDQRRQDLPARARPAARELLPKGRFEIVSDSRTFIPEDQPGKLTAAVREFLAERQQAVA